MSSKVYAYIAFSYLNAATAFLIGWLMHMRITTFAVVAVINEWDLDEKAAACRNAGLMYLMLAVCLSLRSAYQRYRERMQLPSHYEVELTDVRERVPLLCSTVLGTEERSHSTMGDVHLAGSCSYGSSSRKNEKRR